MATNEQDMGIPAMKRCSMNRVLHILAGCGGEGHYLQLRS